MLVCSQLERYDCTEERDSSGYGLGEREHAHHLGGIHEDDGEYQRELRLCGPLTDHVATR